MIKVVGVRFKPAGKIYFFDPDKKWIKKGDSVIVETVRGIEFGQVVTGPKLIKEEEIISPLKKVLRIATNDDKQKNEDNKRKEQESFDICLKKIGDHKLNMKLVDIEYTFDNNKVIFYFTAEGRVDFRELVKDLASVFRTRIELRQIGVRDEAKMLGGLGPCGRPMCCSSFLGEFYPVSIKMAKEQKLSLNPSKISGICSRLMCCLNYEHEVYEENLKGLPQAGDKVEQKEEKGFGVVLDTNPLLKTVRVKMKKEDGTEEILDIAGDELIITEEAVVKGINAEGTDLATLKELED
ncbi:stage 0 sporulation family protein [Sedimentibacter sp. zth1]|uniref:PSP1 domain-containing protein n=1 Tax=Sedimentibacter sp. zth1 TaxID=2816908 RepID=UPI001A90DEDB|nr:stage 0 sporulation family protein [Sedimentibacter sp. zth1]QSX04927.1 stage 0 sporulation family protein [Sedimentibacter sp. zth1]